MHCNSAMETFSSKFEEFISGGSLAQEVNDISDSVPYVAALDCRESIGVSPQFSQGTWRGKGRWRKLEAVEDLVTKSGEAWQCRQCGKHGKTGSQIRLHAERHIEGLSFECKLCEKTFKSRSSLAGHKQNKHKKNKQSS